MKKTNTIDTSKAWIPEGYTLEENKSLGKIEWDEKNISLFTTEKQKTGWQKSEDIIKEVKNPLPSAVLKYLLDNPKLIPKKWKEKTNGWTTYIFFDGTILRDPDGERYTLYLYLNDGGEWDWGVYWLGDDRDVSSPSAVLSQVSALSTSEPLNSRNLELSSLSARVKVLEDKFEKIKNI